MSTPDCAVPYYLTFAKLFFVLEHKLIYNFSFLAQNHQKTRSTETKFRRKKSVDSFSVDLLFI